MGKKQNKNLSLKKGVEIIKVPQNGWGSRPSSHKNPRLQSLQSGGCSRTDGCETGAGGAGIEGPLAEVKRFLRIYFCHGLLGLSRTYHGCITLSRNEVWKYTVPGRGNTWQIAKKVIGRGFLFGLVAGAISSGLERLWMAKMHPHEHGHEEDHGHH